MSLLIIPPDKKSLFWSADLKKIDMEKHKKYIIHQVLQYGDLEDFKWLITLYARNDIKNFFSSNPRKTYSPRTFNFVKNYLLSIDNNLDSTLYVSNL